MSEKTDLFSNNRLYQLLTNQKIYSEEILKEINSILHTQPELAGLVHPIDGSYFHIMCRNTSEHENIAYRMIYALSNAGANPNVIDEHGNTPLHQALSRDFIEIGLDLIQALFRIGIDQRIVNKQGKTANAYLEDNPQLLALYEGYGAGIWQAVETNQIQETERLIKGLIKIDCKDLNNKTLLEKAHELRRTEIIRLLADYQVTIEFLHSIFAFDWERVSLIHQYENKFIKINIEDSIHRFTWLRTTNRTYSKHFLEFCLETNSFELSQILFQSSEFKSKLDINIICTDGLPFYFHMFNQCFSEDIQKTIYSNANLNIKSSTGETFLFHLIHLYIQNDNHQYFEVFNEIITNQPLLLTQRNEQGRTTIDEIELTPPIIYNKLKIFSQAIKDILLIQYKMNNNIERYVLNGFGYHLLLLFNDETLQINKFLKDLLHSIKLRQDLPILMNDLIKAIANDDLGRLQNIFKIQTNIYLAIDWAGRTCAHLAVLYRRHQILSYISENYNNILNIKDNLHRTPLHYACIMNDNAIINILQQGNANKVLDCLNLYPHDYKFNRDLCSEEFHAYKFPENELEKDLIGISDYLKLTFYFPLKKSIEENSIENIQLINTEMNTMGFYMKDFNPNSYVNDWIQGERYVPLLFLALEHRSVSSIQYLMELGLPLNGRMYITKSVDNNSRCVSFRARAEELECFDIIGMINDLEDDNELKHVFKRHLSTAGTMHSQSSNGSGRQSKRQRIPQQETINQNKSQACILL